MTDRKVAERGLREAKESAESAYASLHETVEDLERFNRLAVGRELRMIELKQEINGLLQAAGEPPRYEVVEEEFVA